MTQHTISEWFVVGYSTANEHSRITLYTHTVKISTPPYSTPSSPTKRKLNATGLETAIPLEVVSNIEKESMLELLGDNIKEQAAKLKDRAQRAVKDPKIDHDDLRDSWRTLLMLIDSRTNETVEIEAHKATDAQQD